MRTPALLLALALAPASLAQVTDESLEERIAQLEHDRVAVMNEGGGVFQMVGKTNAAIDRAFEGVAISELTPTQIGRMLDVEMFNTPARTLEALRRCRELMRGDDVAGANASLVHARLMIADRGYRPGSAGFIGKAVRAWLDHPEAGSTIPHAAGLFAELHQGKEFMDELQQVADECAEPLGDFARAMLESDDPGALIATPALLESVRATDIDDDAYRALRERAMANIGAMLDDDIPQERFAQLRQALDDITRAEREATLVGSPMPPMDIRWSSDQSIGSFEDYRGKVLVLDFWATWCGPCIMSFPQVRALREKYDEDDVAIVGVTSIQGTHYPQGAPPVSTANDPEREFELMTEFIADLDITWDVVFTRQDVFNPDYVIRGIPHVVIIDPAGVVRHRGLHPTDPTKSAKINAILEEFAGEGTDR